MEVSIAQGRRERNKSEKRARIIAAARQAFEHVGFEAATLSDIASAARVAKGTLFLYARSKEDLLFLVFQQALQPIVEAKSRVDEKCPLLMRLLGHFGPIVAHNRLHPDMARPFQKEIAWMDPATHVAVGAFMDTWLDKVSMIILVAQARGEVHASHDVRSTALIVIDTYLATQRRWLAGQMSYSAFAVHFPNALAIVVAGLASAIAGPVPSLEC